MTGRCNAPRTKMAMLFAGRSLNFAASLASGSGITEKDANPGAACWLVMPGGEQFLFRGSCTGWRHGCKAPKLAAQARRITDRYGQEAQVAMPGDSNSR